MKRVYNDIPLQSVLFCVSGNQKIRVLDGYDDMTECVFNGLYKDAHSYQYERIMRSKLHGMWIDDDVIVFRINTERDEF